MSLKYLLSCLAVARLDHQSRLSLRTLRDYLRHETTPISDLEIRSCGIRLFAAWSLKRENATSHTTWQQLSAPALA